MKRFAQKTKMIRLGVNIDHIATLRQVRAGQTSYPNLIEAIKEIKKAKAQQITIHLREDRRHIQDQDVINIAKSRLLDLNLEMAATGEMLKIAIKNKPDWVCLVPEKRHELTTEGGLNVSANQNYLKKYCAELKKNKIKVSVFIEANIDQVKAACEIGANACEFHTGHWVNAKGVSKKRLWEKLSQAAKWANQTGLIVNAGHGLDYQHAKLIKQLPYIYEVNIGHSLVCYSIIDGIFNSTFKMNKILNG